MDGAFGTPRALEGDPVETPEEAAARLGLSVRALQARALVRRLPKVRPQGRPCRGAVYGLPRSTWDACAVPAKVGRPRKVTPGPHANAPWTDEENDILRRLTRAKPRKRLVIPWARVLHALPRHGKAGIRVQRRRLGLTEESPLRDDEMAVLRAKFGRVCRRVLLKAIPGRSWSTLVRCARAEGLSPLPKGHLLLSVAAAKFGYHVHTFKALLARHKVRIYNYHRQETTRTPSSGRRKPWRHVDEAACARAVALDLERETVAEGAARCGVAMEDLRAWMVEAGHPVGGRAIGWMRFAPAEIHRVLKAHATSVTGTRKEPR